jgi:hypothetical protein
LQEKGNSQYSSVGVSGYGAARTGDDRRESKRLVLWTRIGKIFFAIMSKSTKTQWMISLVGE